VCCGVKHLCPFHFFLSFCLRLLAEGPFISFPLNIYEDWFRKRDNQATRPASLFSFLSPFFPQKVIGYKG